MHNKKAQSLYGLFLFLVVFWIFLLSFATIFHTSLMFGQYKGDDPYLFNNPTAFYSRMATFQYFDEYPIPTIIFDGLILLSGIVSYMILHPLKGG